MVENLVLHLAFAMAYCMVSKLVGAKAVSRGTRTVAVMGCKLEYGQAET